MAKVQIEPSAVLLTESNEIRQLAVRVLDAHGGEITGRTVSWSSSAPAKLSVSQAGVVRAEVANGSTQVTATVDGVASRPLLVVVTRLAAGTVVLSDSDISGDVRESDDNGPAGTPGNALEFTLTGGIAAPAAGAVIVGNGEKPVAGVVSAVDSTGAATVVRFTPGPLTTVFPELVIDEEFQLGADDMDINPEIAAAYDVVRDGSRLEFRPRESAASTLGKVRRVGQQDAVGTRALPPFGECTSDLPFEGLPLSLGAPPLFSFDFAPRVQIVKNALDRVDRWLVVGPAEFSVEAGIEVDVAFDASITCKAELITLSVPIGGPLSLLIGGVIPVGVGFTIGGELTVAQLQAKTKVGSKANIELGLACPEGGSCSMVRDLKDSEFVLEPELTRPGGQTGFDQIRLELEAKLFGYTEVQFGSRLFRRLRVEALEAKAGAGLAGEFAPRFTQVADAEFKAAYGGKGFVAVEAGSSLDGLAEFLGLDEITFLELGLEFPFAESPKGRVTANRRQFLIGEEVRFTVEFDVPTLEFIPGVGPFNLREIVLLRQVPGGVEEVARQPAVAGQSAYSFDVVAAASGRAEEYFGFVVTALAPLDLFALEVGAATASGTAWSDPATLAIEAFGYAGVDVAVARDGRAVAAWTEWDAQVSGYQVAVARYAPGQGWTTPERVSNVAAGQTALFPRVGIDQDGRILVAWSRQVTELVVEAWVEVARYVPNGGWSPAQVLYQREREIPLAYDLALAVNTAGQAMLSWIGRQLDTNQANANIQAYRVLAATFDPDSGWSSPVERSAMAANAGNLIGIESALDDGGNALVAWRSSIAGIQVTRRDADGVWSTTHAPLANPSVSDPVIAVNPAGHAAILFWAADTVGGSLTRLLAARFDPSSGWAEPVTAVEAAPAALNPGAALLPDGTLHVLTAIRESGVAVPVALRQPPGGAWEAPVRLMAAGRVLEGGFSLAGLGASASGELHAVWHDRPTGTSTPQLSTARYAPGTGWNAAESLEQRRVLTGQTRFAVGPGGQAIAGWVQLEGSEYRFTVALFE